jgi:hypothetical protein
MVSLAPLARAGVAGRTLASHDLPGNANTFQKSSAGVEATILGQLII